MPRLCQRAGLASALLRRCFWLFMALTAGCLFVRVGSAFRGCDFWPRFFWRRLSYVRGQKSIFCFSALAPLWSRWVINLHALQLRANKIPLIHRYLCLQPFQWIAQERQTTNMSSTFLCERNPCWLARFCYNKTKVKARFANGKRVAPSNNTTHPRHPIVQKIDTTNDTRAG